VHGGESNIYASKMIRKGDVEKAFAQSYRIFEGRYTTQAIEHAPMEPFTSIADWDANGRLTVHASIGRITLARVDLARTLKMPISRIRVVGTVVAETSAARTRSGTSRCWRCWPRRPGGR